jgi:hypothetical protein
VFVLPWFSSLLYGCSWPASSRVSMLWLSYSRAGWSSVQGQENLGDGFFQNKQWSRYLDVLCWRLASNNKLANRNGVGILTWTGEDERERELERLLAGWQLLDFRPRMRRRQRERAVGWGSSSESSSAPASKQVKQAEEERHSRFAAIRQAVECVHVPVSVCTCPVRVLVIAFVHSQHTPRTSHQPMFLLTFSL